MPNMRSIRVLALCTLLSIAALVVAAPEAHAHAHLQSSEPAVNAVLHAENSPVLLTFNSRVDAAHSSLSLLSPDGKSQALRVDLKAPANTLRSQIGPIKAGHYVLHWQAVASDGHISRGEIPFDVK